MYVITDSISADTFSFFLRNFSTRPQHPIKFSPGSHVSSASVNPFHLTLYSTVPI